MAFLNIVHTFHTIYANGRYYNIQNIMQHNLVTNYCLFYMILDSSECFKVLSTLNTMKITKMSMKQLDFYLYQAKKQVKSVRQKDKNIKSEFQVIVIKDEDINFLFNRQKNSLSESKGHMTISSSNGFDILQKNKLFGEISLEKNIKLIIQGFIWQNFIISHLQVQKDKSLLLIQQVFSSTVCRSNNVQQYQAYKKLQLIFEPLLDLLFTPVKAHVQVVKFQKQLRHLRMIYPEISKESQINYSLIYYYAIMQAMKQK